MMHRMERWTWPAVAVGVVVLLAAGAAWAAGRFQMAVKTENAYLDTRDLPSPLVNATAREVRLTQVGGGFADLSAFQGKTVLISFWSSF